MPKFGEKDLDKLLDKMSKMDPDPDKGAIGDSKEYTALEQAIQDLESEAKGERKELADMAKQNNVANNLQIAKEVVTFKRERDAAKKIDKNLDILRINTQGQKKHNKRAAQSRHFIEKQNTGILKILKSMNQRGGGAGPGGGGPGPGPGPGGGGGPGPGGGGGGPQPQNFDQPIETKQTAYQMTPEQAAARKRAEGQFRDKEDTDKDPKGEISTDVKMSQAGKVIEDTATGEMRESTAGTFEKGAAKDFFSDEAMVTNQKNMRKLRVGGKGLVRAETDRTGNIKFREESDPSKGLGKGGGQYADAIAFEDSENRMDQLAGNIKKGMGYAGATRDRGQSVASKATATMATALKDNAGEIQQMMDKADDQTKDAYRDFQQALQKRAEAKTPEDKEKLDQQVREKGARAQVAMGDEFAEKAGVTGAVDDLYSEESKSFMGIPLNKTGMKDFFGVDSDASFGEGFKQAFTNERFFGDQSLLTTKTGKKRKALEEARQGLDIESQEEGFRAAVGEEGLGISTLKKEEKDAKRKRELDDVEQTVLEATKAPVIEETQAAVDEAVAETTEEVAEPAVEAIKEATGGEGISGINTENIDRVIEKIDEVVKAVEGLGKKLGRGGSGPKKERSGIDTENLQQEQLEVLEEIRDILSEGAGGGGDEGGGGSGIGDFIGRKIKNKVMGKKGKKGKKGSRGARRGGGKKGMMKGIGKGLARGAGGLAKGLGAAARAIPGVGLAVAAGSALFGGFKGARNAGEAFGLEGDEKATVGQKIAGGVGGAISGLTFGLVDAKKATQFFGGKDHRAELRKLQETDPEAAARVQASIDAGVDPDKALKNEGVDTSSGLMKGLKRGLKYSPVGLLGMGAKKIGGKVMDMFKSDETKARDKARDEAKESGLYDRNIIGKSTIDSSKLGEASIEQLEAILHDDDLSEEDRKKVEDALEQKKVEKDKALTDAGLEPTEGTQGDAVAEASTNMDSMDVDAATAQLADSSQAPAPVNVVNQGQQGPASTGDAPAVAVLPGSLRSADSTIQRYQDKRFVI